MFIFILFIVIFIFFIFIFILMCYLHLHVFLHLLHIYHHLHLRVHIHIMFFFCFLCFFSSYLFLLLLRLFLFIFFFIFCFIFFLFITIFMFIFMFIFIVLYLAVFLGTNPSHLWMNHGCVVGASWDVDRFQGEQLLWKSFSQPRHRLAGAGRGWQGLQGGHWFRMLRGQMLWSEWVLTHLSKRWGRKQSSKNPNWKDSSDIYGILWTDHWIFAFAPRWE